MSKCQCNTSYTNVSYKNCSKCITYCDLCEPVKSPVIEYFSDKFNNLEYNYPMNRCKCNPFGTNPRYYSAPHVPCNCKSKCYSC